MRTPAQKKADSNYYEKRKEEKTTLQIPKLLRDKLKSAAEAEGISMIEWIERKLGGR